jgi:hypothetical protein
MPRPFAGTQSRHPARRHECPRQVEFVGQVGGGAAEPEPRIAPVEPGDEQLGLADGGEHVAGGLRLVLHKCLIVRQVRADLHFEVGAKRGFRADPALADQPKAGRGNDVVDVAKGVALAVIAVEQGPVDLSR